MSLLMDALQKEEQEKNKATEQDQSEDNAVSDEYLISGSTENIPEQHRSDLTGTLSLEPITEADHGDSTGAFTTPESPIIQVEDEHFEASKTTHSSSSFKWSVGVLGLVIIGVVLVGIVVYQSQSITPRQLPSPAIARGIEITPPAISPSATQLMVDDAVTGTLIETISPETTHTQAEETGSLVGSADDLIVASASSTDTESQITPMDGSEEALTGPVTTTQQDFETMPVADGAPLSSLPSEIEVTGSLLKITRSKQPDQTGLEVNQAYSAYQSGDLESARKQYQAVIDQYPDSRDALLGLAAIILSEGDLSSAWGLYAQVIRIDPKNPVAHAALVNMSNHIGNTDQESAIKLMLHDHPESSFLYFALGNVYATQTRWVDAQQAYFDAYHYDSTNPDYALNLAISLDRLSQPQAALGYYNTALKLADQYQAQFDSTGVLSRISTLMSN